VVRRQPSSACRSRRSREALASFDGIHRRFEVKGEVGGVTVVDDYGHHPEEVKATLRAAREGFGRPLVAVFQPHRYTRTRDLFESFLGASTTPTCCADGDLRGGRGSHRRHHRRRASTRR
jgi:UDP-N-acetylmuramate-alanine ligase